MMLQSFTPSRSEGKEIFTALMFDNLPAPMKYLGEVIALFLGGDDVHFALLSIYNAC